jgi:hypothetical protein
MTRITLGIKAGGLSRDGACRPEASGVARSLLLETHPATQIRRTELRTSAQGEVMSHLDNACLWRTQEQLRSIGLSSFPHTVHDSDNFSLGIKSCMNPA